MIIEVLLFHLFFADDSLLSDCKRVKNVFNCMRTLLGKSLMLRNHLSQAGVIDSIKISLTIQWCKGTIFISVCQHSCIVK